MSWDSSGSLWDSAEASTATPSIILPLVRNNSYTSFDIKNFPRRIRKPEKSTQALSVYRKGTFRVYIKCLIVASSKVTIKRRGRKKGHCLSYRFERYMEFGDASVKEALPAHPNKKDLTKSLRMQIVLMLQGMENDGSLPRGSVTAIAKRFGVARCTVHRLWKRAAHMRATGLINSPDFNSRKKIPGDHLFIQQSLFVKVSRMCR